MGILPHVQQKRPAGATPPTSYRDCRPGVRFHRIPGFGKLQPDLVKKT